MNGIWETIKNFYVANFGVSGELVELMAADNILLLCASGVSNESISSTLDISFESVLEVICEYLSPDKVDFRGWDESLPINPFSIYQTVLLITGEDDYDIYEEEVLALMPSMDRENIRLLYTISKLYFDIDSLIEKEWK